METNEKLHKLHEETPGWRSRWRDYFFNPSELDLNESQRLTLKNHLWKSFDRGYMFKSPEITVYHAHIDMLEDIYAPEIMRDLRKITQGWGFSIGYGDLPKHVDSQRVSALMIPLSNDDNVPLDYYNYDNDAIIENLYYEYKTWIIRTKAYHAINQRTDNPRIMLTGSIMHEAFDDLYYAYQEGKLFK